MKTTEFSYPSADGSHAVFATRHEPESGEVRAVVQIVHGMIDHFGRYEDLAKVLTDAGFAVAGDDHLGHGRTARDASEFGYFAKSGGAALLVEDEHGLNVILHETYPGLPVLMLGHSMGSFIARLYAVKYPDSISALVIHGTGGPNPMLPAGKFVAACVSLLRGDRYRSKLVHKAAFGAYNKRFPASEGSRAWLTRDTDYLERSKDDPLCGFKFTVSGYRDLFRLVGGCNGSAWFKNYPKNLKTLVISGDADPVGDYGRGPNTVYKRLLLAGASDVTLKLFPGARHELFNETNREEYFAYLINWLGGTLKA